MYIYGPKEGFWVFGCEMGSFARILREGEEMHVFEEEGGVFSLPK